MILLHTGPAFGKGEPQSSPPEELNRWMDGRTVREMKVDKDEQTEDRSIKLWWLVMRGA